MHETFRLTRPAARIVRPRGNTTTTPTPLPPVLSRQALQALVAQMID